MLSSTASMYRDPAGRKSRTVTPVAGSVPSLVSWMRYVTTAFRAVLSSSGLSCVLSMRIDRPRIVVRSIDEDQVRSGAGGGGVQRLRSRIQHADVGRFGRGTAGAHRDMKVRIGTKDPAQAIAEQTVPALQDYRQNPTRFFAAR